MSFKEEYFVWETRLNNVAEDDRISKIVVNMGEKRTEKRIDRKYVITVLPSEYEQIKNKVEVINARKIVKKIDKEIDLKTKLKNNGLYDMLKTFESNDIRETNVEKKNLKHKPNNKMKNKKFRPKVILRNAMLIGVAGLAGLGLVEGGKYAKQEVKDYKAKVATESLQLLKEELNAERIWDASTLLSSSTSQTSISITGKDGKIYNYDKYSAFNNPREDEIKNMEVVKAIRTVAQAQDGSVFRAMAADNLMKKIKNDEIDLSYDGNKEQDKGIEIGD